MLTPIILLPSWLKYEIITDLNEGLKLGRGHVNPSKYCIAVNCDTKEVFTDFLTFCVDVKNKQFLPCISINNLDYVDIIQPEIDLDEFTPISIYSDKDPKDIPILMQTKSGKTVTGMYKRNHFVDNDYAEYCLYYLDNNSVNNIWIKIIEKTDDPIIGWKSMPGALKY